MRLSDGEQQRMEQRLAFRFAAIGDGAQSWLERQLSALSPDCALLTRWCYSASPVSDWANYEFSLFRACAEHALRLREQSPLARELPEPLFLNYVLHPRVNEEELCDCRGFFYAQIRGRIEGLSAREAILAINEWNAEQVCYRATDERTISALGAWRSGFGRCGEESTFAVNVLRAAGIRPGRSIRRAGRTATTITRGSRRTAAARGTFSARVSRRKRWIAAGSPARRAALCSCTAAALERLRRTRRSFRSTAR